MGVQPGLERASTASASNYYPEASNRYPGTDIVYHGASYNYHGLSPSSPELSMPYHPPPPAGPPPLPPGPPPALGSRRMKAEEFLGLQSLQTERHRIQSNAFAQQKSLSGTSVSVLQLHSAVTCFSNS